MRQYLSNYVDAGEQLVVELYVRDIKASRAFYQQLGFQLARDDGNFVELTWEDSYLYLEEVADVPPPPAHPIGNIRVMVPNVDDYWRLTQKMGCRVIRPIEDRYYGLRDFTVAGPDGLALRFGTRLTEHK